MWIMCVYSMIAIIAGSVGESKQLQVEQDVQNGWDPYFD